MSIPIDRVGRVRSGDMAGFQVKVAYDPDNTGGYYILFSRGDEGYNAWVLNEDALKGYFEEAKYLIEWMP